MSMGATLKQLAHARTAALQDASLLRQVMGPIIGLATECPDRPLRRWTARFIAEAAAAARLPADETERLDLALLPVVRYFLEDGAFDPVVWKASVQAAASLYPVVFRYIINKPDATSVWRQMLAVKSAILKNMDSYPPGIRVCAIKFVQRVVETQTLGAIPDPRRPEKTETSLALVPKDHPQLKITNIEGETSGLLDRILGVLQEETSDILLVLATLNSLGALIKNRPSIEVKIINTVLLFNPFKVFGRPPVTTKTKIMLRSIERTVRALLFNVLRRNQHHPLAGRMQQYLERLQQARLLLFQEASKKRPAESDLPQAEPKRVRTDNIAQMPAPAAISLTELFSLTTDNTARNFDVSAIPGHLVKKIIVPMLQSIDKGRLDAAVALIRARITVQTAAGVNDIPMDEDEEYEPDYEPTESAEQVKNRLEMESSEDLGIGIPKLSQLNIGPYHLPEPPPLQKGDLQVLALSTMDRMFRRIDLAPTEPRSAPQPFAPAALRTPATDRNSLAKAFVRLLTRPSSGMLAEAQVNGGGKPKAAEGGGAVSTAAVKRLADRGRVQLLQYILNDWTRRMDVATTWLTEEWYNDRLAATAHEGGGAVPPVQNYPRWVLRFLDELSAFIGGEHTKLLIRFVSEIPGIDGEVVARIKRLALDPERVGLVVSTLHYLALFRTPVRELCLDAVEDLWRNNDGAKAATAPILKRFKRDVALAPAQEATS